MAEQQKDPDISSLFDRVVDEREIAQEPFCYFEKNGIMMRKGRPLNVPAEGDWAVKYQIVVPKSYRREIVQRAHENPLAGHMAIKKRTRGSSITFIGRI